MLVVLAGMAAPTAARAHVVESYALFGNIPGADRAYAADFDACSAVALQSTRADEVRFGDFTGRRIGGKVEVLAAVQLSVNLQPVGVFSSPTVDNPPPSDYIRFCFGLREAVEEVRIGESWAKSQLIFRFKGSGNDTIGSGLRSREAVTALCRTGHARLFLKATVAYSEGDRRVDRTTKTSRESEYCGDLAAGRPRKPRVVPPPVVPGESPPPPA